MVLGSGACKYLQMNQLLLKNVANFKCDQKLMIILIHLARLSLKSLIDPIAVQ